MEEGCKPSFHKPRQVPYALRPRVEAELTRLEEDGILSKVEYSEWATPIVPVVKRNGSVRVCGDFKVSVNPVLLAEQYPLPRIEDIFTNLAGGKHFSNLDHQMVVTEESKKYLTINTHKGLFNSIQSVSFWRYFKSCDLAMCHRPGITGNTWHPVYSR